MNKESDQTKLEIMEDIFTDLYRYPQEKRKQNLWNLEIAFQIRLKLVKLSVTLIYK